MPVSYTHLDVYKRQNGDRFKVQTTTQFGSGCYEWRIYVPKFGMNDRASIGAFLYFDDGHELDFETVSYTHLDVYKRQRLDTLLNKLVCIFSPSPRLSRNKSQAKSILNKESGLYKILP